MYKDFKENYIEQQKQQAAARQARLAKIGMDGSSVASAKRASANRENASLDKRTVSSAGKYNPCSSAPQARKAGPSTVPLRTAVPATQSSTVKSDFVHASERRSVSQSAMTPGPGARDVGNAQRPVRVQAEQNSRPVRRPATPQPERTRAEASRPMEKPLDKKATEVNAEKTIASTVKKDASSQVASVNKAPVREKATVRKPESSSALNVSQKKPVSANTQVYSVNRVKKKNTPPSDNEIFKKELSDSESRAMMFALTGKAETPDDGGEVDIINLGNIASPKKKREQKKKKSNAGKYVGRVFISLLSLLLVPIIALMASIAVIAHGPSETVRDLLVNSAMQASATKWVPYIFLSSDTVEEILNKSEETVEDKISIDDFVSDHEAETEDEWANAQDGMIFEVVNGSTFKAYVLLIKDPSRVFVGTSVDDYDKATAGIDVFQAAKRYGSVACVNGGEFLDNGGLGTGFKPIGLTYSKGKCVNDDGKKKTFLGITKDNELIVCEDMNRSRADALGIRDAVSFQNGNTLIERNGDEVIVHYQDGNTGTAQRTGIGQRKDGTIILVVTDGRSASSLGATHNDMIDLMISYGAVCAGLVDGGSSSTMYYEDYYTKYDYDVSKLDKYQLKGLVNNYKAFTEPRKIPTFIMVDPLKDGE